MDTQTIRRLGPKLHSFLRQFDDCIKSPQTREHLETYVSGQLSDLPRKSVEPIALWAGKPPRTLQEFLSLHRWDEDRMRIRIAEIVAKRHKCSHSIGIIDETGCPKKGNKTPGVQRQWCGATGKTDNCVVTVHLSYAADDFHCLLDSELFLPESWDSDRERCREAGIPEAMIYQPKWQIALELLDRAKRSGVGFKWLSFDEGYGSKPGFLQSLIAQNQAFVAEVPKTFVGWLEIPPVTERPYGSQRPGGRRKVPRLSAPRKGARNVSWYLKKELQAQPWIPYRIKETTRGPFVWEVKDALFYMKIDNLPSELLQFIVARNVLKPGELKYFIIYNPHGSSIEEILKVAFSRWHVERCFEDEKTELGFDHFEGRKYKGLMRHQRVAALTHLFLAEQAEKLKKKSA